MLEEKQLIGVKFYHTQTFEYSYFADKDIQVGDTVLVPVKNETKEAIVSSVNLPEEKIEKFRDSVKEVISRVKKEEK